MPRLLIIFIVGLLCADTDEFAFAIKYMHGYPAPFSVATYGMMADKLYKLGLFLAASGVVVAFFMDAAQSSRRRLIVVGAVAFYVWASARMIIDGYGPMAPFLNEARGFMIFAGAIATGMLLGKSQERLRETTVVFQWVITVKALLVLVLYVFFGGVPLVGDIPSVEIDGGFLMLCLVAVTVAVWRLIHVDRPVEKCLHIASLLVCLAVIIGSYRRLVVIYCGLVFAGWIIPRWIQKRGWIVGGVSALGVLAVAIIGGFLLYAGWFGWEAAASRAQSLLMPDSVDSQQALSSEMYVDDWRVWGDCMRENWLFGLGLRNEVASYGRLTDAVFGGDGSHVSLHTGVYELWIRMGVMGAVYHIIYFALLPISMMQRGAALKSAANRDYVLIACAIIGVFGFFPFSGFNHYMQAFTLSSGILLGIAFVWTDHAEARGDMSGAVFPARLKPGLARFPQKLR